MILIQISNFSLVIFLLFCVAFLWENASCVANTESEKRERETRLLKAELLNIQSFSLPSLLILFIACLQVVGLRPTETARIFILKQANSFYI